MKKILLVLILLASPLIGQENTEYSPRREYKRPVFGLNMEIGVGISLYSGIGGVVNIAPEFYLGKRHKAYFYLKSFLGYQNYPASKNDNGFISIFTAQSMFSFGIFIGVGGYIERSK